MNKVNNITKKWLTGNYGDLEMCETNKYPDYIFYMKDDKVIFEYNRKNGYCGISYKEIWSFLERVFQLERKEIEGITKEWVEEHYKLGATTTIERYPFLQIRWRNITN